MYTTLINASEADESLAKRIYADLLRGGVRPWLAIYDRLPGENPSLNEQEALSKASHVIVLLTKKFSRDAATTALLEAAQAAGKTIIPVLADRGIDTPAGLPEAIQLKRRYSGAIEDILAQLPPEAKAESALLAPDAAIEDVLYLQAGNEAYHLGDFEGALELYSQIPEIETNPKALHARAAAYNALRQHDKALEDINRAILQEAKTPLFYRNRSVALGGIGDHAAALSDDEKALAIEPDEPRNWSNKAMTSAALSRFEEAQEAIQKAIDLAPENTHYLYQAGIIHSRAGDPEAALAILDRALTLNPDYNEAEVWRQIILGRMGRHDEALLGLDKAIKRQPQNAGNYISRSLLNFYLERYEACIEDATAALKRGRDNAVSALYNRAIAQWKLGNQEAAFEDFTQAVSIYPNLGSAAGIRHNTDSEITATPGLEILAALEAQADSDEE